MTNIKFNYNNMPIINNGEQAREILNRIIEEKRTLPCFCTESVYTTEAIFKGASVFKSQSGMKGNLPLIIAFTASYEDRQQLKNYTGMANSREGMLAVKSDIERLSREGGPYSDLDVIVHLDHTQPGKDNWILEEYEGFISSVMWDCSHFSLSENKEMMKQFISKYKSSFIIEGAVDEIYNYNTESETPEVIDMITDPEVAESYFNETGCDLIVANLGTEHRRTEGTVEYHGEIARKIRDKIGRRLVLHGTSSLDQSELKDLPHDGIVKVNLWGNLEALPGKKLAETLIKNLKHILPENQVDTLITDGFLNESMRSGSYRPSIQYLTEKYRRDEVYIPEAASIISTFYSVLSGYSQD